MYAPSPKICKYFLPFAKAISDSFLSFQIHKMMYVSTKYTLACIFQASVPVCFTMTAPYNPIRLMYMLNTRLMVTII